MEVFFAGVWGGITMLLIGGIVFLSGKLREVLAALRVYEQMGARPVIATFTDQQVSDLANQVLGRMVKKEWAN